MSTTNAATTAQEIGTNILNHSSGHRSWGPLTINWYTENSLPLVIIVVTLEGKIIGIGRLDPKVIPTPISYSFKGAAGSGIDSAIASGTLVLDLGKKEVTFDVSVSFFVQIHQKGILFGY